MKKLVASLSLMLIVLAVPATTLAAEFRVSDQNGSVDVAKEETTKNLYIAGNTVNVSGDTKGGLTAAGNTLNLLGKVEDGLIAAGSNVNFSGDVSKNARIAGSNININGTIAGDLLVGASSLSLSDDSVIGGDLVAGVGTMSLNGEVKGNVRVAGGDVTVNGRIFGNLVVDGGTLKIGDDAVISGDLTFRAPAAANISDSATISGKVDYQKTEAYRQSKAMPQAASRSFDLMSIIMSLALLFAFVYVLPKTSRNLVANTVANFGPNLGWGFLTFLFAPIALIVLLISILGAKVAAIMALLYIGFLVMAFAASALVIGSQILKWVEKKEYRVDWLTIIIGVLSLSVLGFIPALGWMIGFVVALAVLGQFATAAVAFVKSQR